MANSGGGGGGSASTDYPDYLKLMHGEFLSDGYNGVSFMPNDEMNESLVAVMNTALGSNPFADMNSIDPTDEVAAMVAAACSLDTAVNAFMPGDELDNAFGEGVVMIDASMNSVTQSTPTLNADSDISFTALSFDADTDIATAWVDPSPAASGEISAAVTAFQNVNDDMVDNEIVPRFKIGMRDINAVQSTAFTLGAAFIEGMGDRDVAKFQGDLRSAIYIQADKINADSVANENKAIADAHTQEDRIVAENQIAENVKIADAHIQVDSLTTSYTMANNKLNLAEETLRMDLIGKSAERILTGVISRLEFEKIAAHYTIETNRMKILALRERNTTDIAIDEKEGKWPLEVFQYGGNLLASIAGGVMSPSDATSGISKEQSALAGAMSGAAAGTMVSPGWGTAIGGVIGGIGGYLAAE